MALITPCQSRLFGYLYSLLCNLDDTEDVLQQAVLSMWRRFDDYDRSRSFLNWAMKFAELTALNHIRAKRRGRVVFNEELVLTLAGACSPEQEVDFLEAYHDGLLRCMDQLSPADRELIRLCYFEKCNIKRAAEKLGRSPQSVCNSLKRIRGLLFDCIQASYPSEDDA
jgi:RNA polymerase sigma-70 factor, ECF subfamily